MKEKAMNFIIILFLLFISGCSESTEEFDLKESVMTRAKEQVSSTPELCKPLGPGVDSSFSGGVASVYDSFHWSCSKCSFLNSFFHESCVICGTKNKKSNMHKDPNSPIVTSPKNNQNNSENNSFIWYAQYDAQKYYIDIAETNKYQNNIDYADGVNYAWFMMVKIMKLNDANVTLLKCKTFIDYYLPIISGSYKDGYIVGANAAINSYNEFAATIIAAFQINDELDILL